MGINYKTSASFHCVNDFNYQTRGANYFAYNIAEYWVLEFRHLGIRSDAHSSWHEAFKSALDCGSQWAIFYRPGNQFYFKSEFLNHLSDYLLEDTMCLGHILDKENEYLELHPQCFVLNMDLYKKIGRPNYENHRVIDNLQKYQRSTENFHDNYTPMWIKKDSGQISSYTTFGSEIISRALCEGYNVVPFNETLRNAKIFLYDGDDFLDTFSKFKKISDHAARGYYGVNTERLLKDPFPDKKLETLYIPPSGLLPFKLFREKGYLSRKKGDHVTSRLTLYDISEPALDIYRNLLSNWSGENYPDYLQHINKNYSIKEKGRLDKEWHSFLNLFGGESNWLNWFHDFKYNCEFKFRDINILSRDVYNRLFLTKPEVGVNIMWLSNIFHYMPTHLYYSNEQLMNHLNKFMKFLKLNHPDWVVRYNTTEKGTADVGEYYDKVTSYKDLTPAKFPWSSN